MRDGRIRSDVRNKVPLDAHAALAELPPVEDDAHGPPSSAAAPAPASEARP
jgi:hypothetical protein